MPRASSNPVPAAPSSSATPNGRVTSDPVDANPVVPPFTETAAEVTVIATDAVAPDDCPRSTIV